MKEKKRKKVGIVLIAIIVLCIIGIIASPSDDKKDDSNPRQTEQQNTEVTEQASETTEPKTEEKDEPAEIDGVDIIFSDTVRNDKTGNWRLAKVTGINQQRNTQRIIISNISRRIMKSMQSSISRLIPQPA